jgi:flavin reductase (DIM6/NTAB) family NADH-FMN oxidoreductase RutF
VSTDLRPVMRNFATGVCVVSTYVDRPDGRHHDAVTINSLTSVSLDPPLVSLCLRRGSAFLADLLTTGQWAVSILAGQASDLAHRLARDRLTRAVDVDALPASPGAHTGALLLDTPSWLECRSWQSFELGDHVMVVGEVVAAGAGRQPAPLIFLHGGYHTLAATPAPTTVSSQGATR